MDCKIEEKLENNFLNLNLWETQHLYAIEELFKMQQCRVYLCSDEF